MELESSSRKAKFSISHLPLSDPLVGSPFVTKRHRNRKTERSLQPIRFAQLSNITIPFDLMGMYHDPQNEFSPWHICGLCKGCIA